MRLKKACLLVTSGMVAALLAATPLAGTTALQDEPANLGALDRLPGQVVIEALDPGVDVDSPEIKATVAALRSEAARRPVDRTEIPVGRAGLSGGLFATFDAGVPQNVRAVFEAAINQWDAVLVTPAPVEVRVSWLCFNSPGLLGYAGPTEIYPLGPSGTVVPAALGNVISGADRNGSSEAEIEVALNAELYVGSDCSFNFDNWYISTSPSPGPTSSQLDLYTVVLHEVAHGLGFFGSAIDPDGGGFAKAQLGFPRLAYDLFVYSGSTKLLSLPNPNGALTNTNLFFDIGGGRKHEIFAPFTFQNGSSFSHFDSSYETGDPGALMAPTLDVAELRRVIDGPTLGVLAQQGWKVLPKAITPIITTTAASGQINVSWNPNLGEPGTPPLNYLVQAVINGEVAAQKTVPGGDNSTSLNQLLNGSTYEVRVTPRGANGSGTPAVKNLRLPAVPNKPEFVDSPGVGLDRTVTWKIPPPSGGGSETYRVQYRVIGGSWTTIGTTSNSTLATPTLSEAPYQFRVQGENSDGVGAWGTSTIIGVSDTLIRPFPLDGQVGRLYSAYFLRDPDQAGYSYWIDQRARGTSLNAISAAFAKSPEFVSLYGSLSDSAFIDRVYQNVQNRNPDATGKAFWLDYLQAGNTRGAMMVGFSESPEYTSGTDTTATTTSNEGKIHRLYVAFFQREADAGGLGHWTSELAKGTTLTSIANGFVSSSEFQNEYGSLSNDRFVELVYANVLIRTPDSAGYDFWLGQLASGAATRGAMMASFAESVEFIIRTGSIP